MDQIPLTSLRRLPYYYNILCDMEHNGFKYVSSGIIAKQLGIDDTLVRKDIASTGYMGKPKVGFNTSEFKDHLENFLGMNDVKNAIIIGTGNLGIALAKYNGFKRYGLKIVAMFDRDETKIGMNIEDREVLHISKLESKIKKLDVRIAILALPGENTQEIADILTKNGIKAIWNFAPVHLKVPEDVFVWNEDLAASFITLSQFVSKKS